MNDTSQNKSTKTEQANEAISDETVLIKKYANRRLYHTERSSYVTLDDLSEMVRDGREFVVQDAKTGEDITRSVLTQIIFDAENNGQMMLPTNFLREIIRLYGDSMQSFVPSYLEQAMANLLARQDEFRQSFDSAMAHNPAMIGFEQLSKMNQEWIENSLKMFSAVNPLAQRTPDESREGAQEIQEMKAQLKDMQDKLSKLANK